MTESPTELPQRQLAQELRFAIDDARASGRVSRVRQLVKDNPRGWRSSHVVHNLGSTRMRWLEQLLRKESAE